VEDIKASRRGTGSTNLPIDLQLPNRQVVQLPPGKDEIEVIEGTIAGPCRRQLRSSGAAITVVDETASKHHAALQGRSGHHRKPAARRFCPGCWAKNHATGARCVEKTEVATHVEAEDRPPPKCQVPGGARTVHHRRAER